MGDIDVDTDLLRWQAISCDNGEQALSEVCQLIAPDVGNAVIVVRERSCNVQ